MAGIAVANNTYAGEYANEILTKVLMVGKTIAFGGIIVHQDIKTKERIALMGMDDDALAAYSDDFTAGDDIDYSERELEPKGYSLHKEFFYSNLRKFFFSNRMALGISNTEMPEEVETAIVAMYQNFMRNRMDKILWLSDSANVSLAAYLQIGDGLLKKIAADADVIAVAGTTLTKANIIDEFEKIQLAEPDEITDEEDLFYYMSPRTHKLYKQAIGARDKNSQDEAIMGGVFIDENRTLLSITGFPENTVVATTARNLRAGTDLLGEENEVSILDMRPTTLDNKIRFRSDFKLDQNHARGEEIVFYS